MWSRSSDSSRTPTANVADAKRSKASAVRRERPVRLAELCLEPEMHARLVANLDHAPQRLVESGLHSTNYCILGLVGEIGTVEIAEVVILDPVVEGAIELND